MPYPRAKIKEKFRPSAESLLGQVCEVVRYHHYAILTEEAYVHWLLQFIRFNDKKHPQDM